MVSTTPEAEALRPALRFLDVDEDTFESLTEVVADTASENAEQGPNELAALLQDALEPFLLALGAEQTSIPGVAMQVAVSLRGLPSLEHEPKKGPVEPTKERLPDPVSTCVSTQAQLGENKKPSMTLADFCSGAPAPRPATNVQLSTSSSAPRTLGSIWTAQANSAAAAVSNMLDFRPLSNEHDEKFEEEHNQDFVEADEVRAPQGLVGSSTSSAQDGASICGTKRRVGGTKAARRAAAAAATTSGTQSSSKVTAEQEANLQEIAAHGLRETQLAVETSEGSGKRGIHIEGPGSRNVHLENISLSIAADSGTVELLRETDLHLQAGHVYGLVGRNGAGKTTLMRRLAARALPGAPQHLRFGYVAQELAALSGAQTPVEAVVASDVERCDLLKKHAELDASLEGAESFQDAGTIAAAEIRAQQLVEVERQLEAIDADGADQRARTMLLRLGLDEAMLGRQVSELSGGWQMRVALAAALSIRPDVLLLDEPTNHLDLHGVLWLQEHLHREWGAGSSKKDRIVVIVSHDRSFLDACATDILEIHSCKLRNFTGNYSSYIDRIAQERKTVFAAKQEADQQAKEAKKEMQAMKKKARDHEDEKKVRQLKGKEKKVERTSAHDHDRRFKLTSACELGRCILPDTIEELRQKMREDTSLRFRFPEADPIGDANLLEIDAARIRQGRQVILHNVTLTLDPRSRVAIVGSNGSGKSTLMRALAREIKAEEGPKGRGRVHPAYDPGFVSQNHLERQSQYLHLNCLEFLRESLPDEKTLRVEYGAAMTKQSDDSVLRAHLGNFGLGKDALKKVGVLSGGQRARLSLAVGTSRQPSLLLLDEPTNHLDVDSLDALSFGLQAFEGAVVVVSHNRGFLQALCDELWIVRNGSVTACPRGEEAFTEFFAEYARGVHASLK